MKFEEELRIILNKYSKENDSNTPDFILAQYLISVLNSYNVAVQCRETWFGRDPRPKEITEKKEEK